MTISSPLADIRSTPGYRAPATPFKKQTHALKITILIAAFCGLLAWGMSKSPCESLQGVYAESSVYPSAADIQTCENEGKNIFN